MDSQQYTPVRFQRETRRAVMLRRNESGELEEFTAPIEFRNDPLTGRTTRLVEFNPERIIRPDLDALEQQSRELFCPFCPPHIDKITPLFVPELVPEGTIRTGEAFAFPNNGPYDVFGVVVVMSAERHFIRPAEFDTDLITNALMAARDYLKRVDRVYPDARHHFIAWNYMPPSGGSLVHPHLQCNAGYHPTGFQTLLTESSHTWHQHNGTNFWNDLLHQEQETGERYIGRTGNTEWLTAFAPKGRLSDVMAFFPGKASILDLDESDWRDFAEGILKVLACQDELNVISLNMCTYSGPDDGTFTAHARITPRSDLLFSPVHTSDQFYYPLLQDESTCILPPEEAARRLRETFDT